MKNALKYLLGFSVAALLSACGGDGSDTEPADQFVGNWRQICSAKTTTTGETLFSKGTLSLEKASPTSLIAKEAITAFYTDAACTQLITYGQEASLATVNIGEEAVFLGLNSRKITWARHSNGEVLPGYIGVSGSRLYMRTYTPGTTPLTWGSTSPADRI